MKTFFLKSYLLFLSIALLIFADTAFGQTGRERFQQQAREIESRRIAFITREVSLTPEEAQIFWPVYNEYNQRRSEMMMRHRSHRVEKDNLGNMSERELLELADTDIRNMEEMVALRREYHQKFKEILPVKKVILLYEAERRFNRQLLREGRQGERRGRN